MTTERATRFSKKEQPLPLDPALQNKLVNKFGAKLMKRGFTALPVLVQEHYRRVPGNPLKVREDINPFTGEVEEAYAISYMTPTEYAVMTAIWSFWWSHHSKPWPSVEHLCEHVGKSERQVRRYLKRLRDKGFLLSVEQYNSEGKQISNRYDFTPFLKRLLAYLDALDLREKPAHAHVGDDTFDREWVSDPSGNPKRIANRSL